MEHVTGGGPGGASAAACAIWSVPWNDVMRGGMSASFAIALAPIVVLPLISILLRELLSCSPYQARQQFGAETHSGPIH